MCLFLPFNNSYPSLFLAPFHALFLSFLSVYSFLICFVASLCFLLLFQSIMEPQQQQQQQQNQQQPNDDNSSGAKGNFLCRQSSTRWTPTTDQIRILKDLYYNSGVRSPSAEQIQRISARLRQYGKIEGKNVFYWFQNHKARERQKKRFTTDVPMQQRTVSNASNWKPEDYSFHNKYPNIAPGWFNPSFSSLFSFYFLLFFLHFFMCVSLIYRVFFCISILSCWAYCWTDGKLWVWICNHGEEF